MLADRTWETGIAWLSAPRNGGTYRLWDNTALPSRKYKVENLRVCYAESRDGRLLNELCEAISQSARETRFMRLEHLIKPLPFFREGSL